MNNVVIDMFKGKKVGVITAAGSRSDSTELIRAMQQRGAEKAEWIPIVQPCRNTVRDPRMVETINSFDYIYFTGGSPGSLHSCLYGDTSSPRESTPVLDAIKKKELVAGLIN